MKSRIHGILAIAIATCLAQAGCGGSSNTPLTPEKLNDVKLREVGELYRVYQINSKKPPKSLKDLAPYANATLTAYETLRKGDVVVRYGATLPDTEEEPKSTGATEVLAYLKDVPSQGGPVMMLDRSTKSMTPEEFKSAKFAGTE